MTSVMAIVFALLFAVTAAGNTQRDNEQEEQIHQLKLQVLQKQIDYEKIRGERDNLQQDLADRDERLSEAAERERAAKVRASRSRSSRSAPSVSQRSTNLAKSSSTNAGTSAFSGGLREITMYCPTGNSTASGKTPRRGMVATISRAIPFGTRVLIEGIGEFVVEDRIGHGSEFDIFTPSCAEADRFGRHRARVTILGE